MRRYRRERGALTGTGFSGAGNNLSINSRIASKILSPHLNMPASHVRKRCSCTYQNGRHTFKKIKRFSFQQTRTDGHELFSSRLIGAGHILFLQSHSPGRVIAMRSRAASSSFSPSTFICRAASLTLIFSLKASFATDAALS